MWFYSKNAKVNNLCPNFCKIFNFTTHFCFLKKEKTEKGASFSVSSPAVSLKDQPCVLLNFVSLLQKCVGMVTFPFQCQFKKKGKKRLCRQMKWLFSCVFQVAGFHGNHGGCSTEALRLWNACVYLNLLTRISGPLRWAHVLATGPPLDRWARRHPCSNHCCPHHLPQRPSD